MPSPSTKRLALNPVRGRRPVLQNCTIAELAVDRSYQRSTDNAGSETLIRAIARDWDWSLCQTLVVAQRQGEGLFIVDGQHRFCAARLRGDLLDLPCVIVDFGGRAAEAKAFRALNGLRKALGRLDLFRAAIAEGDEKAVTVMRLVESAGLSLAGHTNFSAWKPGQITNVGGILRCQKVAGDDITGRALKILAGAYPDEVLRYGGTLFAGLWPVLADLGDAADDVLLQGALAGKAQADWLQDIAALEAAEGIHRSRAAARIFRAAYDAARAAPLPGSFEAQLAAVRGGAKLVERFVPPRVEGDKTLGGVATGML